MDIAQKINLSSQSNDKFNYNSLFKPERQEDETFADYKERRLLANGVLKHLRRGSRMLWNSFHQGTKVGKFA